MANWGSSAENLRVVVKGTGCRSASRPKIRDFRGQPPEQPWKFGVYAEYSKPNPQAETRQVSFRNFKATSID